MGRFLYHDAQQKVHNQLQTKTHTQLETMFLFNPVTMLGTQGSNENQV
jgi:hypothetical protein